MADNYSQWSESIVISNEEAAWFEQVLSLNFDDTEDQEDALNAFEAKLSALGVEVTLEDECWPDFEYEINNNGDSKELYVYSEEYGSLDNLSSVIAGFIIKFRPDYIFSLTYAETCSRPRPSEFSGGAMIVTATETYYHNAFTWVQEKLKTLKPSA